MYEYAQGSWVLILIDDDFLIYNDYIKDVVNIIKKTKNLDVSIILSNYKLVDDKGKDIKHFKYPLPDFVKGREYFLNYNTEKFPHIHSTISAIFNREKAIKSQVF